MSRSVVISGFVVLVVINYQFISIHGIAVWVTKHRVHLLWTCIGYTKVHADMAWKRPLYFFRVDNVRHTSGYFVIENFIMAEMFSTIWQNKTHFYTILSTTNLSDKSQTLRTCMVPFTSIIFEKLLSRFVWGHRGRDRWVVGFTTTHAISAYHHYNVVSSNHAQARCTPF